ncbi:unnamed protein product [Caenorhabditis nigoni]
MPKAQQTSSNSTNLADQPGTSQPAPTSDVRNLRSTTKRTTSSDDAGPAKKIAARIEKWSIEAVCKYGRRLDIYSSEPNAAAVIKTLFKEVYGSVLSKLNIHPLDWDECADSELTPFLETFNKSVKAFRKNNPREVLLSKDNWRQKEATQFRVICDSACQLAIEDPTVLNTHYEGFSSEVYGETTLEQLQDILDHIGFTENDVFVDVGSGIGQLVTFTAAYTNMAHVSGIEIQSVPAGFADENARQFKRLMRHFGEQARPFTLELEDFRSEEKKTFLKEKATIIFCNNKAFEPELMAELREVLQFCQNGTNIVVTQRLETTKKDRNARGCFFTEFATTKVLDPTGGDDRSNVSWTNNKVPYYLTIVDNMKPFKEAAAKAKAEEDARLAKEMRKKKQENHK